MIANYAKVLILVASLVGISACSGIHHQRYDEPLDDFRQTNLFISDIQLNDAIKSINSVDKLALYEPDDADELIFDLMLNLLGENTPEKDPDTIDQLKKKYFNINPNEKFGNFRPDLIRFLDSLDKEKYHSDEAKYYSNGSGEHSDFDPSHIREQIRGVSGFNTYMALNGLVACHRAGRVQAVKFGEQRFYGRIEGYAYNKNTKDGYIGFRTVQVIDCKDGLSPIPHEYFMHIAIQKDKKTGDGGFEDFQIVWKGKKMILRGKGSDRVDTEALFPQAVKDYIKGRGLDYKLHAGYRSINMLAAFKNGKLLGKDHVLYERHEDSCIDILFTGPPPTYELPPQQDYCLGRCSDPPIINSGT